MTKEILLSICIPTFNGAKYISHNLDTIINQIKKKNITNVEIIVSDNCSTDNTPDIVKNYQKQYPELIRYNRNDSNLLFNGNMLKLCELARGKYIHFMGDDDFYKEDALSRIISVLEKSDYAVVTVSNDWFINDEKIFQSRGIRDGLHHEDITTNDISTFFQLSYYRLWAMSCIIVNRLNLIEINKNIPDIKDWIQITIALYAAKNGGSFYYFSDSDPLVSIRLQSQVWLNNIDEPRIYLNHVKTLSYTKKYGFSRKLIDYGYNIFLEQVPYAFINTKSIWKNLALICKYARYLFQKKLFYKKIIPTLLKTKVQNKQSKPVDLSELEVFVLTYNRAHFLQEQLESICRSTAQGFKIIILNNASTDNTLKVIEDIKTKYPERDIDVITHDKNIGNVNNFIYSQKVASREYCLILHDDDILHPEYIEFAFKLIQQNNAVICSSYNEALFYPSMHDFLPLSKYYVWDKEYNGIFQLLKHRFAFQNPMYKTSVYKSVAYKPEIFGKFHDISFLFDIGNQGRSVLIKDFGIRVRQHQDQDGRILDKTETIEQFIQVLKYCRESTKHFGIISAYAVYKFSKELYGYIAQFISHKSFTRKLIKNGTLSHFEAFLLRNKFFNNVIKIRVKCFKRKIR